jgi:cbb3-type cytochrome oxidase subunit 1
MKRRTYVLRILVWLVPLLFLVAFFGPRFKQLPEWSRDVYPFVLWPLLAIVVILAMINFVDTRRAEEESPYALWYLLAMSIIIAIIYFLNTTGIGQAFGFVVLPLLALFLFLWVRTFWGTGMGQ